VTQDQARKTIPLSLKPQKNLILIYYYKIKKIFNFQIILKKFN